MTCVRFKEHLLVKGRMDVTIEDTFRALAEYSGIHSFNFDGQFADDFDGLETWDTGSAEGTWASSSGQLQGTGTQADTWQFIVSNDDVPKAFVVKVTFTDNADYRGAVALLATDVDNLVYVLWDASHIEIRKRESDSDTTLCSLPKAFTGDREVCVSVQPGEDGECFISVWFDEVFAINTRLAEYPAGRKIGFGVYDADTVYFDDLRIAELTEVLEIVTVDVGETPLGALQRAIGRRHINYFVRWNGELRAWRPKAQYGTREIGQESLYLHQESRDRRGLVSHWRQIGAWDVADAYDEELLERLGHRFHKDDNPDLMTEDDCLAEAQASITRCKEYSHTLDAEYPFCPFQEPEGRTTVRDAEWLLTNYSVTLQAGALASRSSLREYTYEAIAP